MVLLGLGVRMRMGMGMYAMGMACMAMDRSMEKSIGMIMMVPHVS